MRVRTVALLMLGRGSARLAQYAAGLVLLAIWGPVTFAGYAAATGVMSWLFALSSGSERAGLVLVTGPAGRRMEPLFVWFGVAPFGAALLGWLATALLAPGSAAVTYAAAAAMYAGTGCATVLVGLWRLRGAMHADTSTFVAISAGYGVAVGLAVLAGAGVGAVLSTLVGTVTVVVIVLLALLWRRVPLFAALSRVDVASAGRAVTLLAAGEIVNLASIPVLYAEFTGRAPPQQVSAFYVGMLVSGAAGALWGYLLRLWQPRMSVWLRERPEAARRTVRRLAWAAAFTGAAGTALGVTAVAIRGGSGPLLVAGVAVEIGLYTAVLTAAFIVESADNRARARSTISTAVALAVTAVAGWWLIPAGGALGAVVALMAGLSVRGPLLVSRSPGTAVGASAT